MRPRHFLSLLTVFVGGATMAAEPPAPEPASAWALTFENDVFVRSDNNYTNGIQVERSRHGVSDAPERKLLRLLCSGFGCNSEGPVTRRTRIGQLMYTPNDITIAAPQADQRPWAGMLYVEREYKVPMGPDRFITYTGRVGITGPHALAEEAQKWVHKHITDSAEPQGWDNQIGTSLGILASVKDQRRLGSMALSSIGWDIESAWHWQAAAGNIMTYAAIGASFLIGQDQPPVVPDLGDIGNKRINMFLLPPQALPDRTAGWVDWAVFGEVEARAVAFNVFLDGRPGRPDPDVDRRVLVADASLGFQLTFPRMKGWFVKFKMTERSRELKQKSGVGSQRWGALTVGRVF